MRFILIPVFLTLVLAGSSVCRPGSAGDSSGMVKPVSVAELKSIIHADSGHVVLVNVWATWCKWCKEEMPDILKLRSKLEKKGFRLILVSADDLDILDHDVKPTLRKLGVRFSSFIVNEPKEDEFINGMSPDWNGALPTSFIYNRNGVLSETLVGEKSIGEFEKAVNKYLAH
ncbi:MAG TPA: TlpA disulfide reductase family protein [Bacteroidota bacterium]|nr:TlpA disulfide reductase family protein [Bacteroidota bacterium]